MAEARRALKRRSPEELLEELRKLQLLRDGIYNEEMGIDKHIDALEWAAGLTDEAPSELWKGDADEYADVEVLDEDESPGA